MITLLCAVCSAAWSETATLTNSNIVAAGTAANSYKSWSITDGNNNTWKAYAIKNQHSNATSGYHYLQIKKYASSTAYYLQVPVYGTKITSITMTVSASGKPMTGGENSATLFFSSSNNTSAAGSGVASGTGTNSVTIDCSTLNLNTGYITASGAVRIWDVEVTYEDSPVLDGDKYYVAGSWTNPTWGDGKIQMTKKSDGTYTLANQELPEGAQFKIVKEAADGGSTTWYGGAADGETHWVTVDNHTDISLLGGDNGKNFLMTIAGTWTFIVDPTGETPKLTVDGWPEREYYLVGDFNEWAITDSYKFNKVGTTDEYTLNKPIKKGEKFKIKDNYGTFYGAVSEGDFYVNAEYVNTELSLTTENGGENFYMNLSNQKPYWTLDFNPTNKTLVLSNYLSDIAALPFEFDGGRGDIEGTPGLTTNGLGTDYTSSPKLKFTTANNAVILHFDERPGTLTYDIKGNPGSGTSIEGEFVVQTSVDGETYIDLQSYKTLGSTIKSEEFTNLGENVRYIKWLYKTRTSGNVALGNIKLEKYVAPQPYTLTITPNDNADIFVFYNDSENNYPPIEDGDEVLANSEVMVSISPNEGYEVESVTVTDGDGQPVQLTVEEEGISWTFFMPSSDVTVACTVTKPTPREIWVKTDLADLTEDDIFVIVGNNGTNYAMSNDKGASNPPAAVQVVVIDEKLIGTSTGNVPDNIKWNVSGDANNGYIFYPNGKNEEWLYTTNDNRGVKIGNENNNRFSLNEGYLYNNTTKRYLGIYDSQDWRCYTLTNDGAFPSNIANQTFTFYKLVKATFSIKSEATDGETCYATISELGDYCFKVVGDVEVRTVNVINGKLNYPVTFYEGDVISGDGAYLVVGAAGSYTFPAVTGTQPLPDNALKSSGKSGVTKSEMETINGSNNKFYKLAKRNGKIGFYWGADKGAAFDYNTPRQAYLVVPLPETGEGNLASAYFFDGDATGIYSVNAEVEGTDAESVYSLSGIRMDGKQLPKGIYIVNGKKKVIK